MTSFADITPPLHPLILRSLAQQQFPTATKIQSTLIPLAIASTTQDFLAKSSTGSGKTLSYAIPIVQSILSARVRERASGGTSASAGGGGTKALILVPTRELAEQVRGQVGKLLDGLGLDDGDGGIRVVNVVRNEAGGSKKRKKTSAAGGGERAERMHLADKPEIVVATPSRALAHLRAESLHLSALSHLVIDEADLILSYGHSSEDIRSILSGPWGLPTNSFQSFLMSATLTTEVDELKGIVLKNPVVLKIVDDESQLDNLEQFFVKCSEEDKFLLLYVLLKLKLIKGKCLIFVNDTDRGYRVKLFLEKFGIKAGVLNAELPFNSRYHAVQEFNRGVFDYLIATDESGLEGKDRDTNEEDKEDTEGADTADAPTLISTQPTSNSASSSTIPPPPPTAPAANAKKRSRASTSTTSTSTANEYGVSRGIDFINVSCVVNFDLPLSSRSYTHRVGRTARAGKTGTALSFIVPKNLAGKTSGKGLMDLSVAAGLGKKDEKVWDRIVESQQKARGSTASGKDAKEWKFEKKQVEGFRYRMEDALRSVTKVAVREARVKEIKNEVVNSEKLKAHFEDNPKDLAYLRHDKPVRPERVQQHLKHVPAYLMPRIAGVGGVAGSVSSGPAAEGGGTTNTASSGELRVPFHKPGRGRGGKSTGRGGGRGGSHAGGGGGKRREDPLKGGKFSFGSKGKAK